MALLIMVLEPELLELLKIIGSDQAETLEEEVLELPTRLLIPGVIIER
jgi:hypothetical protein